MELRHVTFPDERLWKVTVQTIQGSPDNRGTFQASIHVVARDYDEAARAARSWRKYTKGWHDDGPGDVWAVELVDFDVIAYTYESTETK